MRVVGLDLSYTATGVAWDDGTTFVVNAPGLDGMARLGELRRLIVDATHITDKGSGPRCIRCEREADWDRHLYGFHPDIVVVEDLPQARIHEPAKLGMLQGVVRLALHDVGLNVVAMPAANVKKLATGKGNASKDDVLLAAVRRLGYEGNSKDEADALWLCEAAKQHYGVSDVSLPQSHLEALAKVTWPQIVRGVPDPGPGGEAESAPAYHGTGDEAAIGGSRSSTPQERSA